jgi:hypothetical protein
VTNAISKWRSFLRWPPKCENLKKQDCYAIANVIQNNVLEVRKFGERATLNDWILQMSQRTITLIQRD